MTDDDYDRIADFDIEEFLGIDILESDRIPLGRFLAHTYRDQRGEIGVSRVVMNPYDVDVFWATSLETHKVEFDVLIERRVRRMRHRINQQVAAAHRRMDGLVAAGELKQKQQGWRHRLDLKRKP